MQNLSSVRPLRVKTSTLSVLSVPEVNNGPFDSSGPKTRVRPVLIQESKSCITDSKTATPTVNLPTTHLLDFPFSLLPIAISQQQ